MQYSPVSKNVSPAFFSLEGESGEGQGGQGTPSEYVLESSGVATIRIILENPEYTIIVTWALHKLHT